MDKLSYSLGVNISAGLRQQGFEIKDYESFTQGLKDAFESAIKQLTIQYQGLKKEMIEYGIWDKKYDFAFQKAKEEGRFIL